MNTSVTVTDKSLYDNAFSVKLVFDLFRMIQILRIVGLLNPGTEARKWEKAPPSPLIAQNVDIQRVCEMGNPF